MTTSRQRARRSVGTGRSATAALVLLLALAGCAPPRTPPPAGQRPSASRPAPPAGAPAPTGKRSGWTQTGLASWYGAKFQGRSTASGERFDMRAMTAAHRELPFGTLVRVTNLRNGRHAVVRINDRGPFVRGRVIDLSRAAAQKLDMIGTGVERVKVEIVRPA